MAFLRQRLPGTTVGQYTKEDSNLHVPHGTQAPQACASTNSAIGASVWLSGVVWKPLTSHPRSPLESACGRNRTYLVGDNGFTDRSASQCNHTQVKPSETLTLGRDRLLRVNFPWAYPRVLAVFHG